MIEALIAAALAGVVTTLARGMARKKEKKEKAMGVEDGEVTMDDPTKPIERVTSRDHGEESRGRAVATGIEQRIRSIADMRLREYVRDGRISEEEYRMVAYSTTIQGKSGEDNDASRGSYADDTAAVKGKRESIITDSMIIHGILSRLDTINYRLGVIEGKISAGVNTGNSLVPVMLTHVGHSSKLEQRDRLSRARRSGSMTRKGTGKGDRREDHGDDKKDQIIVIDAEDAGSEGKHTTQGMGTGSSMHPHDGTGSNDGGSISTPVTDGSSGMVEQSDDELESIKRQIMDVLTRLEREG